jgi:ribosomal protein S18 acetylase RimI-like enzyme
MEPLDRTHNRTKFACGELALDRYFKTQVRQDIDRRVTNCFVAVDISSHDVAGFYTLASDSILLGEFPLDIVKRLPRYPKIPAAKIGRLAVGEDYQGQKLGRSLLADAVLRTRQAATAAFALVVDAKSEKAANFYRINGFQNLVDQDQTLFLLMATAEKVLL